MTMREKPYFLENPDWYVKSDIFDTENWPDDDRGYHLTDLAPQEAIDSYNEFYGIEPDEK